MASKLLIFLHQSFPQFCIYQSFCSARARENIRDVILLLGVRNKTTFISEAPPCRYGNHYFPCSSPHLLLDSTFFQLSNFSSFTVLNFFSPHTNRFFFFDSHHLVSFAVAWTIVCGSVTSSPYLPNVWPLLLFVWSIDCIPCSFVSLLAYDRWPHRGLADEERLLLHPILWLVSFSPLHPLSFVLPGLYFVSSA
jgi:hypothetical protein